VSEFRPAHVIEADAELARGLLAGEERAIRELVDRYGALVFTVANRILDDPARAEEVAQHTFVQAWRHADTFEPGRDFAPWLATIARRAAIDVLRREQRRPAEALEDADPGDSNLVSLPPSAEQIEAVWAVRSAIDSLGEPDREIVRLAHLEGRSQEEISERLGMPVGTVKSRTHRAMRKLANRLAHLRDRDTSGEPDRRSARTEGEADDG
jgi:RNA polymerase sigma factor (sigma-70 family)